MASGPVLTRDGVPSMEEAVALAWQRVEILVAPERFTDLPTGELLFQAVHGLVPDEASTQLGSTLKASGLDGIRSWLERVRHPFWV